MSIKLMVKKSFAKEFFIKSIKSKDSESLLDKLKAEVIKILEKKDSDEVKKAIEYFVKSEIHYTHLEKSLNGKWIEKAGYGIGTVRIWKGKKYKKISTSPTRWVRVFDKHDRGAATSMGRYIAQVKKCQSVEELYNFCMKQRSLFQDENGVDLPIMDKLRAAIDEQSGKLESGKTGKEPESKEKTFEQERNLTIDRVERIIESKDKKQIMELIDSQPKTNGKEYYVNRIAHNLISLYGKDSEEFDSFIDNLEPYERTGDKHNLYTLKDSKKFELLEKDGLAYSDRNSKDSKEFFANGNFKTLDGKKYFEGIPVNSPSQYFSQNFLNDEEKTGNYSVHKDKLGEYIQDHNGNKAYLPDNVKQEKNKESERVDENTKLSNGKTVKEVREQYGIKNKVSELTKEDFQNAEPMSEKLKLLGLKKGQKVEYDGEIYKVDAIAGTNHDKGKFQMSILQWDSKGNISKRKYITALNFDKVKTIDEKKEHTITTNMGYKTTESELKQMIARKEEELKEDEMVYKDMLKEKGESSKYTKNAKNNLETDKKDLQRWNNWLEAMKDGDIKESDFDADGNKKEPEKDEKKIRGVKKALYDLIDMLDESEDEETNFEDNDASQPELFNLTADKVSEALNSVFGE